MRQAAEVIGHNICDGTITGALALFSLNTLHELLVADLCICMSHQDECEYQDDAAPAHSGHAHSRASVRHDHHPDCGLDIFDLIRMELLIWVQED